MSNPKMLVHSLRGNKAQIMLAFLFAGCALDVEGVQSWTGLTRPTAYSGLKALKGMGLVGNQVLAHGRTLWLPAGEMLELGQMSNFFTSDLSSSSSVNNIDKIDIPLLPPDNQMSKFFTSDPAVFSALDEAKIRNPKRDELARLEHVTPELIAAHVKSAPNLALAIYRIQNNWPAPEMPSEYVSQFLCSDCGEFPCVCEHADDCRCIKCRRNYPDRFCHAVYQPTRIIDELLECRDLVVSGTSWCQSHQEPSARKNH